MVPRFVGTGLCSAYRAVVELSLVVDGCCIVDPGVPTVHVVGVGEPDDSCA